jgi:hypothetical protein
MKICKICGETEQKHHEIDWLEIPVGCVCDWREWNYHAMTSLPPVCTEYKGDGRSNCEICEHDQECHLSGAAQKT